MFFLSLLLNGKHEVAPFQLQHEHFHAIFQLTNSPSIQQYKCFMNTFKILLTWES